MMEGGLAEITTIRMEDGRRSIRIGKTRLLDIVGEGEDMVVECKGGRRDPVRAKPEDLIAQLTRILKTRAICSGSAPGEGDYNGPGTKMRRPFDPATCREKETPMDPEPKCAGRLMRQRAHSKETN